MGLRVRIGIENARPILRALNDLPQHAQDEVRDGSMQLAQDLADAVRFAGQADSRQSARAASSVKARRDRVPVITAGGTVRSRGVLFGSEFGMTRRSGWYARGRYYNSVGRQFRPHRGASSYWFFRTVELNQPRISRAYNEMADRVVRRWRA